MKTSICSVLGIEFPVFAFTHCRDVAVAVSRAGGLGVLGIAGNTPDQVESELDALENELGDRPYGIDVLIPAKTAEAGGKSIEELIPERHRQFVAQLMEKYDIPPMTGEAVNASYGKARRGFELGFEATNLIELAVSRPQIKLAASALGPPPADLVEHAHKNGTLVAALVGTAEHARRQMEVGVDIIVAQGAEAGGHTGDIGTMVLVPEVVDIVAPVPVLAAGGIASGRQMAAAMALGAQGVWTGSMWLTTLEAETDPTVKQKMLKATSRDTVRSRSLTGKPARQLRSAWTDEWEDPNNPDPLPMPLQSYLVSEATERISRASHVPDSGAAQLANYFVGQVVGSLKQVRPAREVLLSMVEECVETMTEMADAMAAFGS